MKLLLDENLSPRLIGPLASTYPESRHVEDLGLRARSDREIWQAARRGGFMLVSKDDDFRHLAALYGAPPKVVWLRIGNAGTSEILRLLLESSDLLARFAAEPEAALLPLAPVNPQ